MSEAGFVTFGTAHLVAAGLSTALAVAVPILIARANPTESTSLQVGRALATVMLLHEIVRIGVRTLIYDEPLVYHLPLHLCGISLLLGSVMLWRRNYRMFELVYFWGIGGSLAAILTPDIPITFPHPVFIAFFTGHALVLLAVFYAVFVYGFRPRLRSVGFAIAALLVLAAIIFPLNFALDTNFLYLAAKPVQASPIDFLGPWPWYILGLLGLTVVICLLAWLPFARRRG